MAYFRTLVSLLLLNLTTIAVFADVIIEEGYTVTTVVDGNKLGISPHSILPQYGSSDLIILDSADSTFYTLSLFQDLESVIKKLAGKRFAGNGVSSYSDGILSSAMFNHPKSFALDFKGNVYVADRIHHAIRKISKSGVTTIAGGYSQIPGRADGPARNASFSDDFEVSFIPERCALMISDHGNKLIRQINLKNEDCAQGSQSVLGMTSAWALALVSLLGLIVGFVTRPYILPHPFPNNSDEESADGVLRHQKRSVSLTQPEFVKKLVNLSLSQLSLMFRPKVVNRTVRDESASLLDSDHVSCRESSKSSFVSEQLKGLISLDGGLESVKPSSENLEETDDDDDNKNSNGNNRIDNMIHANLVSFEGQGKKSTDGEFTGCSSSSGLVKRKAQQQLRSLRDAAAAK